jgi:hypothetical protein
MPTIVLSFLLLASIEHRLDSRAYVREIRPFVSEYKKSTTYWASAFLGTIISKGVGFSILGSGIVTVFIIFLAPAAGHYIYNRPFGVNCKYVPVNEDKGILDIFQRNESIARRDDDGDWAITLEIEAGEHVHDYNLQFNLPPQIAIDFVDIDKKDEADFDDEENQIILRGRDDSNFIAGVYLTEENGEYSDRGSFEVKEVSTGRKLCSVALID